MKYEMIRRIGVIVHLTLKSDVRSPTIRTFNNRLEIRTRNGLWSAEFNNAQECDIMHRELLSIIRDSRQDSPPPDELALGELVELGGLGELVELTKCK